VKSSVVAGSRPALDCVDRRVNTTAEPDDLAADH